MNNSEALEEYIQKRKLNGIDGYPSIYSLKNPIYKFKPKTLMDYCVEDDFCDKWNEDFIAINNNLIKIGIELSDREKYYTYESRGILAEINDCLEWVLDHDFNQNDFDSVFFSFKVKPTYDKTYYCIAKICDEAQRIIKHERCFEVIFSGKQIGCIELMYFFRDGCFFDVQRESERRIIDFLVDRSEKYRMIITINDYMEQINKYYGWYGYCESIRKDIFLRIINREKNLFEEIKSILYISMLEERRMPTKWKNEYKLFEIIKMMVANVKYQYRCEWLGNQSFDIFIEGQNVAIEYQGIQHYVAVTHFGGEEGLVNNQKRDARKRKLADDNGVKLIYWDYTTEVTISNVKDFLKNNNIEYSNEYFDNIGISDVSNIMAPVLEK